MSDVKFINKVQSLEDQFREIMRSRPDIWVKRFICSMVGHHSNMIVEYEQNMNPIRPIELPIIICSRCYRKIKFIDVDRSGVFKYE